MFRGLIIQATEAFTALIRKVEIVKLVSKMAAIKAKFNLKSNLQLVTISDSLRLYLENLTGILLLFFSAVIYLR